MREHPVDWIARAVSGADATILKSDGFDAIILEAIGVYAMFLKTTVSSAIGRRSCQWNRRHHFEG